MALTYDEAVQRLAADEPRTSQALGAILAVRRRPLELRLLTAGPGWRSACVVVRQETNVWTAHPRLADPGDGPELAHAIARSPALAVEGARADVEPLLEHLGRVAASRTLSRIVVPGPVPWPAPGDATRAATRVDLTALFELYEGYELPFGRTARSLRRGLRRAVAADAVVVLDGDDGRLDGAFIAVGRTPRYVEWSLLTVRPSARGRRGSWALVARAVAVGNAANRGFIAVLGPENRMTLPTHVGAIDEVIEVDLWLPNRVRGERRLRRLWIDRMARTRPRRA